MSVTEDTTEAVQALLDRSLLLVAVAGDDIVGTLVAGWDGWRGNMYRLAVREDHRRRGIARSLVDAGHDYLRAIGARRVTALVGADEEEAGALWESVGYSFDEKIVRYVRNL